MMKINKYFFVFLSLTCLSGTSVTNAQKSLNEQIASEAMFLTPLQYRYPARAKRDKQEGTVLLKILVLASGKVGQIDVEKSSGFEVLDASAKADMRLIEFVPAKTKSGVAIDSWMLSPVIYKLD